MAAHLLLNSYTVEVHRNLSTCPFPYGYFPYGYIRIQTGRQFTTTLPTTKFAFFVCFAAQTCHHEP